MYPLFRFRRPFVLLLAFLLFLLLFLLLLVFDPLTLPVSPPLRSSSFLSDSATRWFSSAHPLVCLSFSAGWTASVLSSSSSSPFSSSPVDFDSSLASLLVCLVFLVSGALVLSVGGLGFRTCLSAFFPPLSSDASHAFSSDSDVFSSVLRAVASSVPAFTSVAPVSTSRPPAPLLRLLLSPLPLLSL